MQRSSIIFFCILAFVAPIAISVLLFPDIFFSKNKTEATLSSELTSDAKISDPSDIKSYVEIPSALEIDPDTESVFIVSAKFSFSELPAEGQDIKLFTKYDEEKKPFTGWALKIKKQTGTIRPEVYWVGPNLRGGWYSFGEIDIKDKQWSSLTLVVERSRSISMFYEDISNEGDSTGITLPKFIGGFTVSEIPYPKNKGALKILIPVSSKLSDKLVLHDLLIAKLKQLDGAVLKLISGGPAQLAQRIKSSDISLWLDARARDRSSYARKILRSID